MNKSIWRSSECKDGEKGIALVMVAILLTVMVGFVALGVSTGYLFGARTSSQSVVDAAALAGALTFITNPTAAQPATATTHAIEVATENAVMASPVDPNDVNVVVDLANRRVTVSMQTQQPTFFARILGINSATVGTTATAEAGASATDGRCTKPWFIPNTILSSLGPCEACAAGETLIDTSTGQVTQWAKDNVLGNQFPLKPQQPSAAIAPGQFFAIEIGGSGASVYRDNIATCNPDLDVACGDIYGVEPGNMVGPTVQGVEELIGSPPDEWIDIGEYYDPVTTGISDLSDSVVIAPVWDTCDSAIGYCPGESFPGGSGTQLEVVGFAMFFLEGVQGSDVVGRIINISSCSGGGAGGGGGQPVGSPVFSFPLRLVRVP